MCFSKLLFNFYAIFKGHTPFTVIRKYSYTPILACALHPAVCASHSPHLLTDLFSW